MQLAIFEAYKKGSKNYKLHVYIYPSTTDEAWYMAKMHPVQWVALRAHKNGHLEEEHVANYIKFQAGWNLLTVLKIISHSCV